MKGQEIFDTAVGGVLAQGVLSRDINPYSGKSSCRYRSQSGAKCAVGHILSDDVAAKFDSYDCSAIDEIPFDEVPKHLQIHLPLLVSLQIAHDDASSIEHFRTLAKRIADRRQLEWRFGPVTADPETFHD